MATSTEKRQRTSILDLLQKRTDQLVADSESRRANPTVPAASNSAEAEYTELSDKEESERVVPAVQVLLSVLKYSSEHYTS